MTEEVSVMPDWSEIKMEYVTGSMGYRALAKNWGVSLCTLQEHGKKGEWPRLRKEYKAELQTKTIHTIIIYIFYLEVTFYFARCFYYNFVEQHRSHP